MTTKKYKIEYGVSLFEGKQKTKEIKFKSEKDMVYFLYKNGGLMDEYGKPIKTL